MIDTASAHYASSRVCFSIDAVPLAFEHRVADALDDLGWKTGLINGQGDRGLDVFAEMREKRVVIQCIHSASALGQSTVQNAFDTNSLEDADYIVIISNADFTEGARWRAAST
jgi:HJR/Mrr/RecB family endonuclease